jgi:hypothetical protein
VPPLSGRPYLLRHLQTSCNPISISNIAQILYARLSRSLYSPFPFAEIIALAE